MTGSVVARRYARALFDLTRTSGKKVQEESGKDLASMTALVKKSPDLARLFCAPVFSSEEKRKVVKALGKKIGINKTVCDFCFLLADKERLGSLERINDEYQAMLDMDNGILRGQIVTAVPLKDDKRRRILVQLEKKTGRALALDFAVDASLLGGMVLNVGDKVVDASLKTQLSLLKDTIKRGD